jgi:toxin ParE1/3/4
MPHRLAPEAEHDLDQIAYDVAMESGFLEPAEKLIDTITRRFSLLAAYPFIGRDREADLGACRRSYSIGNYTIFYRVEGEDVCILRVIHGRRDIQTMFH